MTAQREMERQLHRQQEFARRLIDCFPDLVVALDPDGRCTFISPRCKDLLGCEPEQMIGQRLSDRLEPADRAEFETWMESVRSAQAGAGRIVDVYLEGRAEEMRLFRTTGSPLLDEDGQAEGLIVSLRDVTDSRKIEQQLIQSERLAAMGQMVAGAAHELNNPLTAVLGVTEMLKDTMVDPRLQHQLELVHSQARRAANIVQSLLSFSRPSHSRKQAVQMDEIIERSLRLHEGSLQSHRVTVDFQRDAPVGPVLGDANQLTQVFLNLIVNAEQAIREARDHGTLRIRVATHGETVVATFQDDGAGIRRDVLPRIFDPFFTTKRPGRGTGLGLSICLAILREHLGNIEAKPLPNGGSIFTLSIPVAKADSQILTGLAPAGIAGALSSTSPNCSVLVVDDEEGIRQMVREGLAGRGMRVDAASTGEEALCLMESRRYDVVLTDINLRTTVPSALNGREFYAHASRLTASGRAPVFIFMTGELAEQHAINDDAGRQVHTLQKPFRISEIARLVNELAEKADAAEPLPLQTA